jgi:hypothetical protein
MIHLSKINQLIRGRKESSMKAVSKEGEILDYPRCVVTSFFGSGDTFNIMLLPSREIRKVNRYTLIEFNGEEVVL